MEKNWSVTNEPSLDVIRNILNSKREPVTRLVTSSRSVWARPTAPRTGESAGLFVAGRRGLRIRLAHGGAARGDQECEQDLERDGGAVRRLHGAIIAKACRLVPRRAGRPGKGNSTDPVDSCGPPTNVGDNILRM